MLMTRVDDLREFRVNGELSDICVSVGHADFHLHKFPLFLNSEFFRALCRCGMIDHDQVTLSHFPGGAKTFSLIADYCYGLEVSIDYSNVAELRCAAEFLQMTSQGNLVCETSAALSRILRSSTASASQIVDIMSRCCRLGAIASHTNVVSACFSAIIDIWRSGSLPEEIVEALQELPVEWFVGLVVGARDSDIEVSSLTRVASQYLKAIIGEHKTSIEEILPSGKSDGKAVRKIVFGESGDFNVGEIMDHILIELPEDARIYEVMDSHFLCLLFRLAAQLHCKCEVILIRAISQTLKNISMETLVTMPTTNVISIVEHNIHSHVVSPTTLCDILDKYLWERVKQQNIDLEEFHSVIRALPKRYRQQHDSLLMIVQELFCSQKLSEETKLKILDTIEPHRLHEKTLRHVSERNVIPSSFIVSSALAVSSRLRNELTEVKAELKDKEKVIREVHGTVADVIKGQWEYNDVILNVTPKDTENTSVQFAKVLPRNISTELSMEHEAFEGRLTLCVRSCRATPTQGLYLFDPFNEQLIEIKRSKYDNLMVGDNYQKKKHTTSYWPFNEVS